MRIAIDARIADYTSGGIARYTSLLLQAFQRIAAEHTFVGVRARRPKVPPLDLPAAETLEVWTPAHHRLERWALWYELRGKGLDLLHSPDLVGPRRGPWRQVITVHDLAFLRMPRIVTSDSRRYYGGIRRAAAEADAVIAVSQATARDLVDLVGAPEDRIHVVYEAADPTFAPMPRQEAADHVRASHGVVGPYVLFVGTLEPRKNLPTLLRAFSLVRREFPLQLVIAGGRGWLADDVFETVQDLALAEGVRFLGQVSPQSLRALYCAAEVFALPSLYEGFGLPCLEAMACGTPVLASNAGSLREVVGDAGVLVRPDDPDDIAMGLGWVLGNPSYREALIGRGLARAATFSWDRAARETLAIYERVLAS